MGDGLIVRVEDWPHGLRCGLCSRSLDPGDRYAEQLTHMAGEVPVVKIICVPCDLGP